MGDETKQSKCSFRPLNKLPCHQIDEVRKLNISGEATPLVLFRIGLRVVLERDVVQLAAFRFPDRPVIKLIVQHPFMAFPIVAI